MHLIAIPHMQESNDVTVREGVSDGGRHDDDDDGDGGGGSETALAHDQLMPKLQQLSCGGEEEVDDDPVKGVRYAATC